MSLRFTEEEYQDFLRRNNLRHNEAMAITHTEEKPKRKSKYGNQRVEIGGMKFDSKHEATVYTELMRRQLARELKCVLRQVPFDLPGGIKYIADFVTIAPDMRIEGIYDAKSEATRKNRVYINKKKQIKAIYGIEIREV